MEKLKLAFFVDNFYPEISGISDSVIEISNELAKQGHKIQIYAPNYSSRDYKFVNLPEKEIKLHSGIKIIRVPSLPFHATGQGRIALPCGLSLPSLRKFNPDAIHVHLPFGLGLEGLLASKILKVPLIGTNHTPLEEFIKNSPIQGAMTRKFFIKYLSWFYNHCNFVSFPSKAILNELNPFLKTKMRVIPNPVSDSYLKSSMKNKQGLIKKYHISGFNLVYCGRLSAPKKIDVIIKAIVKARKNIPDIRLHLIGEGNLRADLEKMVKKLDVQKYVHFHGYSNKKNIAEIYSLSDIFAIMGVESQCLAAMQAMTASLPVICINNGGLQEYVGKDKGSVIEPDNPEQLAHEIYLLYKFPEKRKKLGKAAMNFMKKFSPKIISNDWIKIYRANLFNSSSKSN